MAQFYRMFFHLIWLQSAFIFSACGGDNAQPPAAQPEINFTGKWNLLALQYIFQAPPGSDEAGSYSVSEDEWETKAQHTMPVMTFGEDHSYAIEYIMLTDETGRQIHNPIRLGSHWSLKGDSITLYDTTVTGTKVTYLMKAKDNRIELSAHYDINNDGIQKDQAWMLLERK